MIYNPNRSCVAYCGVWREKQTALSKEKTPLLDQTALSRKMGRSGDISACPQGARSRFSSTFNIPFKSLYAF